MLWFQVTLSCLQKYLLKLKKACQTQVLRLSELQAENVKYDKQLLTKCASERRLFCEDVSMGSGQVYECLFRHKDEQRMSPQVFILLFVLHFKNMLKKFKFRF